MSAAAKSRITARRAVLVKGGHMENEATDVLFDGREFHIFRAPKIATRETRARDGLYALVGDRGPAGAGLRRPRGRRPREAISVGNIARRPGHRSWGETA